MTIAQTRRIAAMALAAGLLSASGAALAQDAMGRMQNNQTPNPVAAEKMNPGAMTSDPMPAGATTSGNTAWSGATMAKPMTQKEKMAADKKMKADKMAMAKHDAMMKKDAMKSGSMAKPATGGM